MAEADRRSAVVQAFAASRAELLAAIDGLDDDALSRPVLDGWSVRDHLAHVAHMDEIRFFEVQRVMNGYRAAISSETQEQSDVLNAFGVENHRGLPLKQILWELEHSRSMLLDAIRAAPLEALDNARYGEFSLDGGVAHEREHAITICDWRRSAGL